MKSDGRSGKHRSATRRRPVLLVAAVVALLVLAVYFRIESNDHSAASAANSARSAGRVTPSGRAAASDPAPSPSPSVIPGITPGAKASASNSAPSAPVELRIAAIGVDTGLQSLGLVDGALQTPSSWNVAGWYAGGVYPGQVGPAVIAGHIDSTKGPAVFYRLRDLVAGDQVTVTEQNGTVLTFVVDDSQSYPKNAFPASAVYGPTPYPVLRLITCTGDFDYATHNYLDNLVVTAHLA